MANYNTGNQIRFDNSGKIFVGATTGPTDEIINIVPGSIRYICHQREAIPTKDRGTLGAVIEGDQRPQEIEFQVHRTATTGAMLAVLKPAATNGARTLFFLTIRQPDYLGATTGDDWKFGAVYMPDGEEHQANSEGPDIDKITVRLMSAEGPVAATSY